VKLRYTVRKRGKLFWQPTPEMRALGFGPKALGDDGPEAQAEALKLYQAWQKANAERFQITTYPPGTFGAYWDRLRGSKAKPSQWWSKKAKRTREDYERAWAHIDAWRPEAGKPTLSRTIVSQITTELCEQFYAHLAGTVSPRERWRAIKGLKILLDDAVVRLRLGYASPAGKLVNPQPAGRSAIWLGAEILILAGTAQEAGYAGMNLAIRIAWESMFSPVDVWTLPRSALKRDATGWYLERDRTKTAREAFAAISDDLATDMLAYMEAQPFDYTDDTPIIRQRNGHAYRSKDTFGDDFRAVRAKAFPADTRMFLDIRRSANVEADAAGADKKTMGELLANGLADSKFLEETYTPPTVTKAREVALQRVQGRAKLAGEVMRNRSKSC
jgi:hypothetical protein